MSPKILVVDDEPDILELAQTRLEMAGYETLTAESGEGVEMLFHGAVR